jgi:putative acetyltransferase
MNKQKALIKEIRDKIANFREAGLRIDMESYMVMRGLSLMKHGKFKKLDEPKAKKEFHRKPLVRKEKDYNAFTGMIWDYKPDGEVAPIGMDIYELSGKGGKFYLQINNPVDEAKYTVWTAHFFERYYQRVISKSEKHPTIKQREEAIKDFMRKSLLQWHDERNPVGYIRRPSSFGISVLAPYNAGMGLGNKYDDLILMKTFISKDQYTELDAANVDWLFNNWLMKQAMEKGEVKDVDITRSDAKDPGFIELTKALDAELAEADGEEHSFYDQYNQADDIKHVVVAYEEGEGRKPLGIAALKPYSYQVMEVKRMYTAPEVRGAGLAGYMLAELEMWAKELKVKRLILETGKKLTSAIKVYKKHGYTEIPNYGPYAGRENSICFEKFLTEETEEGKEATTEGKEE